MRFRILRWVWLLAVVCLSALAGCVLNPITGERQLMLISAQQEMQMGAVAYQEALKKASLSKDAGAAARIERIGRRLAAVADPEIARAGLPPFAWEFRLIQDDATVNAFALPGGKVAVYTGILKSAGSDDEIAVVMGHEIAHAIGRHGAERVSYGIVAELGLSTVDLALSRRDPKTVARVQTAFGIATDLAVMKPFSRKQESQADSLGLRLMAEAGYDPRAALSFWRKMERLGGARPPEFLSTHPSHARRIADIRRELPAVIPIYERNRRKAGG